MGDRRFRVIVGALAIVLLAGVALLSYNLGAARGIVEGACMVATPDSGAQSAPAWPRAWGLGLGFGLVPLFFILFWILTFRGFFWRRGWGWRGYRHCGDVPPSFDEWHRRARRHTASSPSDTLL